MKTQPSMLAIRHHHLLLLSRLLWNSCKQGRVSLQVQSRYHWRIRTQCTSSQVLIHQELNGLEGCSLKKRIALRAWQLKNLCPYHWSYLRSNCLIKVDLVKQCYLNSYLFKPLFSFFLINTFLWFYLLFFVRFFSKHRNLT